MLSCARARVCVCVCVCVCVYVCGGSIQAPVAEHGELEIGHGDDANSIKIERLHVEHYSGKSIHTLSD